MIALASLVTESSLKAKSLKSLAHSEPIEGKLRPYGLENLKLGFFLDLHPFRKVS